MTFAGLVTAISNVDRTLRDRANKAINISLTVRNWLIGYYLVEFEQNGKARANYGSELLELKCYVLVDLKLEAFSHENIGQLNTYVSWYDKNVRVEADNPPVGILLCTERDHALVEYATAAMNSELFVSKYQLELPSKELPQKEIEAERNRLEGGA